MDNNFAMKVSNMNNTIEFCLDFVSPTSYLAYKRINQLKDELDINIAIKPILLGGLLKAANNVSPITVPAKLEYSMGYDLPRYAKLYDVELNPNPHFPINTLPLLRGAFEIRIWAYLMNIAMQCSMQFG